MIQLSRRPTHYKCFEKVWESVLWELHVPISSKSMIFFVSYKLCERTKG